ncbi:MAG TPA: hypothetical protein VK421_09920 [Pyrinomonadaceae bacterium]|nr:hypothetical protein [Pyrinomonadaceae bacterium]
MNFGLTEILVVLFLLAAVVLIVWVLGKLFRPVAGGTKICRHCAETIKAAAVVCRFCGRDV